VGEPLNFIEVLRKESCVVACGGFQKGAASPLQENKITTYSCYENFDDGHIVRDTVVTL